MTFAEILLQLLKGAGYTIVVTLVCSLTGVLAGLLAIGIRVGTPIASPLVDLYAYIYRGTPLLVMLFLIYFGLPGIGFKVDPLTAMALSLGLIAGANLSEVFRGALGSVSQSEIVAAQAMGFKRYQILLYIEFPQMLRFSLPGMINEFTTVLKYSPFAYTVGIPEITKQAMALSAVTLKGVEIYFGIGILYFLIYRIFLFFADIIKSHYAIPENVTAC